MLIEKWRRTYTSRSKGGSIAQAVLQPRRLESTYAGIEIDAMQIPAAIPAAVPVKGPMIANSQTSVLPNERIMAGAKR